MSSRPSKSASISGLLLLLLVSFLAFAFAFGDASSSSSSEGRNSGGLEARGGRGRPLSIGVDYWVAFEWEVPNVIDVGVHGMECHARDRVRRNDAK
jgi:hypothetical protein